ncbi:MAG: hypothetical protein MJ240_04900 [Kiritimatiellae bacterium]|nr:hypothetical protein [Kiritimatiellia bacterium]
MMSCFSAGVACLMFSMVAGAVPTTGFDVKTFTQPAPARSPAYFWMWKDRLDLGVLLKQLEDMKAHGLDSVCVHPVPKGFRPGYFSSEMTPDYLTPEYLDILKKVCDRAGELGMNFWFYDEGGWPSGGACGQVAASDTKGEWLPLQIKASDREPGYEFVRQPHYTPGRGSLPSALEKGATERFIELTHERVYAHMPEAFGQQIRFTFMDEPEWPRNYWGGLLGWSKDFADEFRVRKGYDILPHMARILATYHNGGDDEITRRRIDYYEVVSDLFVERFMLPLRDWGRRHGVKSSGHVNGEDQPGAASRYGHGNLMKTLRAMDAPGVDVIWRQLFPNYGQGKEGKQSPFPRYAKSAANQIGAKDVLSESFGIYGASVTPGEMKWLVDYQMLRGVNMFTFGYYAMSYSGQWMTLFEPQSGPQTPYWDFERPYFEYIKRVSSALAEGDTVTDVAVFFDARGFFAGGPDAEFADRMHREAAALLDRRHVDYDFVDDDPLIAAEIRDGALRVGPMAYNTLVVPSEKWMKDETRAKIAAFRKAGGRVIGLDGIASLKPLCEIRGLAADAARVTKRVKGNEALYFIVNESPWDRNYTLRFPEKGAITRYDPVENRFYAVKTDFTGKFPLRLSAFGSEIYLVNSKISAEPAEPKFDYGPQAELKGMRLDKGWTLTKNKRYFAGNDALEQRSEAGEPIALDRLGDWRSHLGWDFSGVATYETSFTWDGPEEEFLLDLGEVCWTCRASFNGQRLPDRFFGPFAWRVTPKKGSNVISVTVANSLVTALSDDQTRLRIRADHYFPGISNYEPYQSNFDKLKNESGLIGPVVLRPRVEEALDRVDLPKATFDPGGTSFDLKALSCRDFPATAESGGLSFSAKREKEDDPKEVLVCELDWKKIREEWRQARKAPPRGVVFKYRFKQQRVDPFDPKVWLAIKGLNHNEKGELVECQATWNTKIRETGDVWADYCYYDIGIRSAADTVRFTLKLGDGLGTFEIKDFRPIPFRVTPGMDASKYLVAMRQVGTGSFDGVFHLGSGQAGNVILDWRLLDKERAPKINCKDLTLCLQLPKGVDLLDVTAIAVHTRVESVAQPDGSTLHKWKVHDEKRPVYGRWKNYFRPAFFIRSDLPAGTQAGTARISAEYEGREVSLPVEMPIVVDDPVVAKSVPKEYVNGIQCGPEVETGVEACAAFADTMIAAGFRGAMCIREPFAGIMKEKGRKDAHYFKGAGLYFIANGYTVGTHPPTPAKRPLDERFVADDPKYKPELMAASTCPMAVYENKSYYRDHVVPGLRDFFDKEVKSSGYDAILANWEPNPYFNHGCMCTNCLHEFIRWSKLPAEEVNTGWPQNVRIGGRFRAQAEKFRAWQHGKLMKTLHRTFLDFLGPGSYGFCPMLAWTTATGQLREAPGAEEIASEEYMGDLEWFDPWGPYPWWDAQIPYVHEKRYCVAGWASAKVIREKTDATYANHVKLLSFPHGRQGAYWEVLPEWLELNLDAYFFNRWECSLLYKYPVGYDARWHRCCARATERAAKYEDYVFKGKPADSFVSIEPVAEYAAPCHMVSSYLPMTTNVSPLCTAAYDLKNARIIACANYWEEGEAFFTIRCRGLKKGCYTVVSDRETVWTQEDGRATWTAEELEKGAFVAVGKVRTKVFEIRPAGSGTIDAHTKLTPKDVRELYEKARPRLRTAAERDHVEEKSRTLLTPNGTPMI